MIESFCGRGLDVVGLFCLDIGVALEKWGVLCSNRLGVGDLSLFRHWGGFWRSGRYST